MKMQFSVARGSFRCWWFGLDQYDVNWNKSFEAFVNSFSRKSIKRIGRFFMWDNQKWLTCHLKENKTMKYASAFYVAEPSPEIYIFVDEDPSGLPDGACEIIGRTESEDELISAVEPYFILGHK